MNVRGITAAAQKGKRTNLYSTVPQQDSPPPFKKKSKIFFGRGGG
jgi:hypothetical protein